MVTDRNTAMAAVKGIAIILMVAGHAEGPWWLTNIIYVFHMPVFFIAAGYFFSERYLDQPWEFIKKRVKGLYVPFVKWSLFFLLLHNVLFHFGILNEQFGNATGGTTHPYSAFQFLQRFINIVFSFGGYDEFMAGAFWFFRALFFSALAYLGLRILLRKISSSLFSNPVNASAAICILALAFTTWKIGTNFSITTLVQGGIRECWGVFFFSTGCLIHNTAREWRVPHWGAFLLLALIVTAGLFHCAGMNLSPRLIDVLTLPITGIAGFLLLRHVCEHLTLRFPHINGALVHCGLNTVYIYVFHIVAFKVVSLLKIWCFHLPFAQIGCHMVIHDGAPDDYFWILYTIVGVGLPLLWIKYLNHNLWGKVCPLNLINAKSVRFKERERG